MRLQAADREPTYAELVAMTNGERANALAGIRRHNMFLWRDSRSTWEQLWYELPAVLRNIVG